MKVSHAPVTVVEMLYDDGVSGYWSALGLRFAPAAAPCRLSAVIVIRDDWRWDVHIFVFSYSFHP